MNKVKIAAKYAICIIGTLLVGCTNQEVYEAVQQNRQHECQKLPEPAAEKCMEQHSESYEDYEREREELLK